MEQKLLLVFNTVIPVGVKYMNGILCKTVSVLDRASIYQSEYEVNVSSVFIFAHINTHGRVEKALKKSACSVESFFFP